MNITKISLAFIFFFLILSCRKDEDLTTVEIFGGDYVGSLNYTEGNLQITNSMGMITVIEEGGYWSFQFSNEIPSINNIQFLTSANGEVMMNEDATETHLIRITARTLQIIYEEEGQFWEAQCSRP